MKIRVVSILLAVCALAACFFSVFKTETAIVASAEAKQAETSIEYSPKKSAAAVSDLKPQNFGAAKFAVSGKVSEMNFSPVKNGGEIPANAKVLTVGSDSSSVLAPQAGAPDADANLARIFGAPMPAPALSFDGIRNYNNGEIYGVYLLPSDTNGDVGLNHYVQTVNALVRIYDKTGAALTPPFRMSNIFAPLNTPCAQRDDGSPTVLYDALADRWMLSQYCNLAPPFRQMIAVSQTGDPTGAYYLYEFIMPGIKLNDYSKFGVWPDGYYMTDEEYVGSDFTGFGMFAFDRRKMLAGDASAGYIYFNLPSASPVRLGSFLPADLDGLNAPPTGAPNLFSSYTATEYGAPADALRLFDFHADFQNPQNSSFTERAESPLPVAAFDPTSPEGRADIAQPAPGDRLDANSDRLMYRAAYRNFGTHQSLVLNQTVRTSSPAEIYRAGVRVYELRRSGASGSFAVHEQATIGDNTISRWVASAAQDHQGNLAFQYSIANEITEPSIYYAGKLAAEPSGVFRAEREFHKGDGVQTAFGYRWGNNTGMTVDVTDDCTFWLTNQYYSQESQAESPFSWLTRIGKFKFAECTAAPRARIGGTVTNSATGQPINRAQIAASDYSRMTSADGTFANMLVLPGTYTITAAAKGFRPKSFVVTASDGQSLIQNFALEPIPLFENAPTAITAESCAVNNAAEPGETITLSVALRNTGALNTTNLIATLLAGGGVINPSAPQNYGALPAGGASVARPFTFTVAPNLPCGTPVSLTFRLEDAAAGFAQEYTLSLATGTGRIAFAENFDSVTAPELPAGWTSSAAGAQRPWTTRTTRPQSAPNSAFSPDPNQVGVNELVSPEFSILSDSAELSFRNWYELETTFLRNRLYDGAVLEIKIGTGRWQDIETDGGAFLAGGYDGVLESAFQNPLGGRRAWSGRSGNGTTPEFTTSRIRLPAVARGSNVRLRWRVGTDNGGFREGQYIDDLIVTDGVTCGCPNAVPNRAPFDFDGDGKTDLAVFRASGAAAADDFFVRQSSNNQIRSTAWGDVGDAAVNADYDGDSKTDFAVFRPSNATWYILRSSDATLAAVQFGLAGDRLVPADYDGDRRADIAVYRGGTWYRLNSSNNQFVAVNFGQTGDVPAAADFDGDGKIDTAVFRPSNGTWYISQSTDNGLRAVSFGASGDVPVSGDFDGDGKSDFAVFRPSNAAWYILRSAQGFAAVNFGSASDKPLQADFDGDGRRDIAVFRPSSGAWFYLKSSDGQFASAAFGTSADTAVPSIYVY